LRFWPFVSSPFFDSELVCAPPVLTTTPDRACDGVDPVAVDVASESFGRSDAVAAVSLSACVESDESDDSEDEESGVSAHAIPQPYPVTTAAPTSRVTAKPPTRPTTAAAFMKLLYAR
jgi:hypothetical protein